jgi:primosomal protein N''
LNKQGLGGNGQSALEQMKQIEKQWLNKVLRTKRFKDTECKTGIIKIEHRHSTTRRGKQTPIWN